MRDVQRDPLANLLIVDDEPSVRSSMSQVLVELGYSVRSAEDGLTALVQLREYMPDIILSDLNMPGMSGFEFLSVVRRRFPLIRVIAMSGAFSGDEVPSGVAADSYYQKGSGVRCLLMIIQGLAQPKRLPCSPPIATSPQWIQRNGNDASGEPFVTVACPECLRTFSQTVGGSLSPVREAHCTHCKNPVYYAIVEPVDWTPELLHREPCREAAPASLHQVSRSA